ncbi:hypothetical protein F383_33939 [Gossypium arboreum]|uniref:Uncharacterized protein n=1 Tax=Gossypium arboreum TaxID=29729 RepID=A0A0B0PX80_GOSAR|nr:hypothetical protein F383_33939 [Gossypium arboreum]
MFQFSRFTHCCCQTKGTKWTRY